MSRFKSPPAPSPEVAALFGARAEHASVNGYEARLVPCDPGDAWDYCETFGFFRGRAPQHWKVELEDAGDA